MEVDGIPVTDPIRTWMTLCSSIGQRKAEECLDCAERDGLIDREELLWRVDAWRRSGRNGVAVAVKILDQREAIGKTPQHVIERRLLRIIRDAGIKAPECQYPVRRSDGRIAYLDVAWPELRYGSESDGNIAHATPAQRSLDAERQNALLAVEFVISRFTWQDIQSRPNYVAHTFRTTIRALCDRSGVAPRDFGC